jgi:hypothetical protein
LGINDSGTTQRYGFGVFCRFHKIVNQDIAFFAETGIDYSIQNKNDEQIKNTAFTFKGSGGILFFPDPTLGIECSVALLQASRMRLPNGILAYTWKMGIDMTALNLGLHYYF